MKIRPLAHPPQIGNVFKVLTKFNSNYVDVSAQTETYTNLMQNLYNFSHFAYFVEFRASV